MGVIKKPKPKKKKTINDDILSFSNLIEFNKEIISSIPNSPMLLTNIDLILNSQNNVELFLLENQNFLSKFKTELMDLKIFELWYKCFLEMSLSFDKQISSFLSKLIDVDIITIGDIIKELQNCINKEITFYNHLINLNKFNNNVNKCKIIDTIINQFTIVKKLITDIINNKSNTINDIETILNSIKLNIIKHNNNEIYLNSLLPFSFIAKNASAIILSAIALACVAA